jgi:Effector-associated domain 1
MTLQLTPSEVEQFKNALLSAFPRQGDLVQLLYFRLEVSLDQIVAPGPYNQVVTELVIWSNAQGKVELLLTAARAKNPGNPQLHRFEKEICIKYGIFGSDDEVALPQKYRPRSGSNSSDVTITFNWRNVLIETLIKPSVMGMFSARTSLLHGIPAHSLNRSQDNARLDLTQIIDQLESFGQLTSGQWPLLQLIENALPYVDGFEEPKNNLLKVQSALKARYKVR